MLGGEGIKKCDSVQWGHTLVVTSDHNSRERLTHEVRNIGVTSKTTPPTPDKGKGNIVEVFMC